MNFRKNACGLWIRKKIFEIIRRGEVFIKDTFLLTNIQLFLFFSFIILCPSVVYL